MFAYDSIIVSSTWELISVSMCYSQGAELIPPCLGLCTVPTSSARLCSFLVPFLLCVYLPWHGHVLPGTQVIKDNVCKPTIAAVINRPPPSEAISHVTRVPDHKTRSAKVRDSCLSRARDPVRKRLFIYEGEAGRRIRSTAEGEESPLGGQLK